MKSRVVIVTGATGKLGEAYLAYFRSLEHTTCIGVGRKSRSPKGFSYYKADLIKKKEIENVVSKISLRGVEEVILIHTVGKFKFEETGIPEIDLNNDGIDDEIYDSNFTTFFNIVDPLIEKIDKENLKSKNIKFIMCAFGSISDKYNVPYWQSYTRAKNHLKRFMAELVGSEENSSLVKGIFINVSTTDTGNERGLRPFADTKYWLKPKEIVNESAPYIIRAGLGLKEVEIFKKNPNYRPDQYTNHKKILKRWKKQMGKNERGKLKDE